MEKSSPQFLDIKSYRQKRMVDGAKLLPVVGAVILLFPLPLLFSDGGEDASAVSTGIYLFLVWIALIAFALGLSLKLPDSTQGN